MQNDYTLFVTKFPRKAESALFAGVGSVVLVCSLTIGQDWLHSSLRSHAFYWSESLLFSAFWMPFAPVLALLRWMQGTIRLPPMVKSIASHIEFPLRTRTLCLVSTISSAIAAIVSVVHLVIFALSLHIISALCFEHTYSLAWSLRYAFAQHWVMCLIPYGIVSFVAMRVIAYVPPQAKPKHSVADGQPHSERFVPTLAVTLGKKTVILNVADIVSIQAATPYVELHTQAEKYLYSASLKDMMALLNEKMFVRIHKSTIVNTQHVVEYVSRLNGDYDVRLCNSKVVRMSRTYTQACKQILQSCTRIPSEH
jgi:two-component system, LytTR family, response regulator